jgi:hypothetical protein
MEDSANQDKTQEGRYKVDLEEILTVGYSAAKTGKDQPRGRDKIVNLRAQPLQLQEAVHSRAKIQIQETPGAALIQAKATKGTP